MPELVANGPHIPVHLMNELDSGRIVFFCGAGISAGPGSGLPSFAKLAEHVYTANRVKPDPVERQALDLEEQNPERQRPLYDKALGLLERPERLGSQALRRTVIECLSKPPTDRLRVHEALIVLARQEKGVRLITTNFDNRFVDAGLEGELVDAAPKLPVPKPHSWASLVHLHGRIMSNDDGSNLVLTAADFGRAYLTERWAARFVTELFREFTVVFVGYSVGDPVMSYMVDALAAERAKGARVATAYAFADHDGSSVGKQRAQDGWLAKNVEPILYDSREDHTFLNDTLIKWAEIRNDPFQSRSRIALNEMTKMPSGPNDPVVERVTWALQDPVAAKALADAPPILDEADFAKVEKWLEMFEAKGLLRCAAADANSGGGDQDPAFVRLVDSGFQFANPQTVDSTRAHLARWMAGHLHVSQVLAWVLRAGGYMHAYLRREVERQLAGKDSNIPPRLRLLWTVLLDHEPRDPGGLLWTSDRYRTAGSQYERLRIEDEAIKSLAPRLVVRPGPASGLAFRQYLGGKIEAIRSIDACGHLKLVIGEEDSRHLVEKVLTDGAVLARHAETLTGYLEQALGLRMEDDEVYRKSILYRPSIAPHDQNLEREGWTYLIDLVRDGYFTLVAADRARGDNLLRRWVFSGKPLFERLALHALTENTKSDIRLARKLLVAGRKPGVWELELHREVLRFLRLAGARLPRSLRAEIVRAIHAGPKYKKGKSLPNYDKLIRREKALRLHKLVESGARLDKRSRTLAEEVKSGAAGGLDESNECLIWHGEARWIGQEELTPKTLVDGSPNDVVAAIVNSGINQDDFRGLVTVQPAKAATALRSLAKRGDWPATFWQGFLWSLPESGKRPKHHARVQQYVARVLLAAPEKLFKDIGSAAAGFVKRLAEAYGTDRERELEALWSKVWSGVGTSRPEISDLNDPRVDALNHTAEKLAEAALIRLWKYEMKAGAGLPVSVRPYFNRIGADPEGHLGRVMLATRLYDLFAIDPEWTREHLIARLSSAHSEEAATLWDAYGWSQHVGPDLLRAFKEPFLEMLCDSASLGRRKRNLAGLFMTSCLDVPSELTAQEIRRVVESMDDDALKTTLNSLKNRLRGEAEDRARIWHEKVHPWLQTYWPRLAARNTAETSSAMLQLLVECGDAFPDAVAWSLPYLRSLVEHGLFGLGRTEHVAQHPDSMLGLLDRVIVEEDLPAHQRKPLLEILNQLGVAKPALKEDTRFHRLYQIANS